MIQITEVAVHQHFDDDLVGGVGGGVVPCESVVLVLVGLLLLFVGVAVAVAVVLVVAVVVHPLVK